MRSDFVPATQVVVPLLLLFLSVSSTSAQEEIRRRVVVMGTECSLKTFAQDRNQGIERLEGLVRIVEDTERELSTWQTDSPMSHLNRLPIGTPAELSANLCRLFRDLLFWTGETDGVFDPAVGAIMSLWRAASEGHLPTSGAIATAVAESGMRFITLDPEGCRMTRQRDVLFDAGAFGKGEALDRLSVNSALADMPWLVDLGGQVMVHGLPPLSGDWPIDLAHPGRRDRPLLALRLTSGSLATSSGSEQDRYIDGVRIGHILDPRTGRPAEFEGSVVVWHERALVADILSTALFVMGPETAIPWAEQRDLAVCFLIPGAGLEVEVRASEAFTHVFSLPSHRFKLSQ